MRGWTLEVIKRFFFALYGLFKREVRPRLEWTGVEMTASGVTVYGLIWKRGTLIEIENLNIHQGGSQSKLIQFSDSRT